MALHLTTAGESHGPGLTCIIEGLPAGLVLDREALDRDLARRQLGHGRGGGGKIRRDPGQLAGGGLRGGLVLDREALDRALARRQLGHGRGGRMKIERDRVQLSGGVRHGRTLGGPIAMQVVNRDYANWEERMSPWPVEAEVAEVPRPRPGHTADVAPQSEKL